NALETAADEMATTVFRTAHSAVVRDAMDFSAALCGPTGETVAQAVTIPLQLGSIPNAMKTLFERFGGEFASGDVYLVNHPFDGDLSAQVAACHIGDRSLQELARRYGAVRLGGLMGELLDHTATLLRNEIAGWPDGTVTFTDYLDSDGIDVCDVPITVDLTVRGEELVADFSRSAPMVRGSLNCTPSFAEASVYHTVMAAAYADIPRTAGATRPITVVTKPGTVTHVVMPGASSMRGIAGYRISDVMNGALAQLAPHRVPAAGEGGSTLAFFTGRVGGEPFVYSELVVGTWGGRPVADGNDGLANPCGSMANIPIELAESDWPILIERYGLVSDSGGAGRFRGGLAVERVWRAL